MFFLFGKLKDYYYQQNESRALNQITHQSSKIFKVGALSKNFLVVLAALLLEVLDILVGGWSLECSERCFNIFADFVDQINVNCEVAVFHNFGEELGLEAQPISNQIERLCILKSRDIV